MNDTLSKPRRIPYLDVLKFFAMYLVIWGHATQYGLANSIENGTFHPFAFINNAFHMPLFMTISGIFAASSLKYSFWQLIKNKFLQLLLPAFVWSGVEATILFFRGKSWWQLYGWVGVIWDYWFVKCLFLCYILYWVSIKLFNREIIACIFSLVVVLTIDQCGIVWLNVMLPFFWLGHFMRKAFTTKDIKTIWTIILGIAFIILLIFWSGNYTIYVNGGNFISINKLLFYPEKLFIYSYRFLTGGVGACFIILLFKQLIPLIQDKPWVHFIEKYGRETFAIYMIHVLALVTLANFYAFPEDTDVYLFDFVYAHFYNIIALGVSIFIIWVFSKWKWSRVLFLGKAERNLI